MKQLIFIFLLAHSLTAFAQEPKLLTVPSTIYDNSDLQAVVAKGEGAFDNALAMNVQYLPIKNVREELQIQINKKLDFLKIWNESGEAHITVITPPEYTNVFKGKLSMDEIGAIARLNNIQKSRITINGIGIGRANIQNQVEESYFLIVTSPDLVKIREEIYSSFINKGGDPAAWNPHHYYPHVTIGYTKRDLHEADGVIKDVQHSLDSRFQLRILPTLAP